MRKLLLRDARPWWQSRGLFFSVGALLVLLLVLYLVFGRKEAEEISFQQFQEMAARGQVESVVLTGKRLRVEAADGRELITDVPDGSAQFLWSLLVQHGIVASLGGQPPAGKLWLMVLAILMTGLVALVSVIYFSARQLRRGADAGAPPHKILHRGDWSMSDFDPESSCVRAARRFVQVIKEPRSTAFPSKGLLLIGPPGSGKTRLARSIGREANVPVIEVYCSQLMDSQPGFGASRISRLFHIAEMNAPSVILLENLDALARSRSARIDRLRLELEVALGQLLLELDTNARENGVLVLATTDRPDLVDPAVYRPGRLEPVGIGYLRTPNDFLLVLRRAIEDSKLPLASDLDLERIAHLLHASFLLSVAADVVGVVQLAAIAALKRGEKMATDGDFRIAVDQHLASRRETEQALRTTAP